ncbi:phosphatidylinositol-specific phospholipase C/glycerophosphodiester phosphodiesterase family protein [Maribellus maritimus]|uniref:phosphatidylinositol-specific phospholipase C/glycerophosphodiester phosphodiesterase family protein n=1 Tax=Maribellus maritimus TaxID=2870838 RepID=UPI001EEC1906|nr:phosphatidylinositol-specific phospholipase C/glycerophosphodiester phosphodiesterase family protein [Maribellus maritimus]MCG6190659.1 phosphatidylinositol-specific phospholipase C/glycerophosphodiester phosphodiesterase family protein [Maribellus maritimus]
MIEYNSSFGIKSLKFRVPYLFCFLLPALLLFISFNSRGQEYSGRELQDKWDKFSSDPEIIRFSNAIEIDNTGGHIQGIQSLQTFSGQYFVLTGSSGSHSYCAVVKKGETNEVVRMSRLMDKPFKHAGGFQIYQKYMAVGIEDNELKDKSKVCIYDMSEPENVLIKPVSVIEREGAAYRSTAGCVGITEYAYEILLAVGDWDTRNIDFYSCDVDDFPGGEFRLDFSLSTETVFPQNISDKQWLPWQNINLFTSGNKLFMVGLGQDNKDKNIASLFLVSENETGGFNLDLLASKSFDCNNGCSFKAAAGVEFDANGDPVIMACGYHIEEVSTINRFKVRPAKKSILPAHAHNDYEHDRPLFDALDNQFKSIEADVYSVGDSLYVAHDKDQIKPGRTLRKLYLEPLKKRTRENNGSVYGNKEEIILLVDIKDDATRTYQLLDKILKDYAEYLTVFEKGKKETRAVTVVVSGNRPFEYMQSQTLRYAGYDGRLQNIDSEISPSLMPVVSDNWAKYFSWNGLGEMPQQEIQHLNEVAEKAKKKGYILRFWGTPNQTAEQRQAIWTTLSKAGVGLIGADNLPELREFLSGNAMN